MKIEVIKPKEEVKWNFPCKGISKENNVLVGFSGYGKGVVLDAGNYNAPLYAYHEDWNMSEFVPLEEKAKGNNYDWSNPAFPILAKQVGEEVFTIDGFDEVDNSVSITTFSFNKKVHYWCDEIARFSSEEVRDKWLKSLEILPKGTEIKITF